MRSSQVDDFQIAHRDDSDRPANYLSGDLYTTLATTRETDFDFNAFDFFFPIGGGPPPHVHGFEQEIWYVTDGEVQFSSGDQANYSLELSEGGLFFGPEERAHAAQNLGSAVTILEIGRAHV